MRRMDGDVATGAGLASDCVPLDRIANVSGTANAPTGYRLRSCKGKLSWPCTKEDATPHPYELDLQNDRIAALIMQEERRFQKRLIRQKIKRQVELDIEAYDEDLEVRRDKLREMVLRDEAALTRELIERARELEELRAAELAAKAAEVAAERESVRQALLREKQVQQFIESSHELREAKTRAGIRNAKRANLAQITDIENRRRAEREDEEFWHDVLVNRWKEEADNEAEYASRRVEMERRLAKTLREQMDARLNRRIAESSICETGVPRGLGRDSEAIEEAKRVKIVQYRQDLEEQLLEARRCLEKRRIEEEALDRMTASIDKRSAGSIEDRRRTRQARQKEILAYMEHLKKFREAVARRESEVDECVRRFASEADVKEREARRRAKEDGMQRHRELRLAWDRQIEEKRAREHHLDQDNCDLSYEEKKKEERAHRRQAALEYGRELLTQHELVEARRARESSSVIDKYYEQQRLEKEREEHQLTEELMKLGSRLCIS